MLCSATLLLSSTAAYADIKVLQSPKRIDIAQPYKLTLLLSGDETGEQFDMPDTFTVAASSNLGAPIQVPLQRFGSARVVLQPGQYHEVVYQGLLPDTLRGIVRIEPLGIDAAPVQVAVVSKSELLASESASGSANTDNLGAFGAAGGSVSTPGSHVSAISSVPTAADLNNANRLSFNEPVFFQAGDSGGDRNAKFQLSFKFHIYQAEDLSSRGVLQNLYFGYTQFSLWDLQAPSAPFRDTNYRPSVFYYLPDVGFKAGPLSRIGFASGLEHESNGRDGVQSRSVNSFFVRPSFNFGDLNGYHLTIEPKFIQFVGSTSDNPDIGHYRGHVDLKLALGAPDGLQLSTVLRKGDEKNRGSVDTQFSYPLARWIPGAAGYLMASYFYGYGESLLTYNQKSTPEFRIGYALWR